MRVVADDDSTLHAGIIVARLQASKTEAAGVAEMADQLTLAARLQRDLIGVGMLHVGMLEHGGIVGPQGGVAAEHHFMPKLAAVADDEFDGVARLDLDAGRRKTHVVVHVDMDGARGGALLGRSMSIMLVVQVMQDGLCDAEWGDEARDEQQ